MTQEKNTSHTPAANPAAINTQPAHPPITSLSPAAIDQSNTRSTTMRNIGQRSHDWRLGKGLSLDPARIMVKAAEELGEVARALTGDFEQRPDRGDVAQEAAQTIIVLASLVHEHRGVDVMEAVDAEMQRLGA